MRTSCDGAVKAPVGSVAGADAQRLLRLEILVEIVEINLELRGPAVEVDLDARWQRGNRRR